MSHAATMVQTLRQELGDKMGPDTEFRGETTVVVPKELVAEAARLLKRHGYLFLLDISSVDNFGEEPRFEMVYEYYNLEAGSHLRVKAAVSEDSCEVPSLTGIYQTANWHEREVYDMMGIKFAGHPDLRRILMWEGFPFYPLRKDFPLEGKFSETAEAFTRPVPLEGGPFVTETNLSSKAREPRSKAPDAQ